MKNNQIIMEIKALKFLLYSRYGFLNPIEVDKQPILDRINYLKSLL